jgi:hypothetical protein
MEMQHYLLYWERVDWKEKNKEEYKEPFDIGIYQLYGTHLIY